MGAIQMVVDEQADLRLNYVADKIQIKIIKLTPQQQLKQNQNLVPQSGKHFYVSKLKTIRIAQL